MREGDLVTLSQYANNLDALYLWNDSSRAHKGRGLLVGLVLKIEENDATYLSVNERRKYYVQWMDPKPPKGRAGVWGGDHFYRKDLKLVSRAPTRRKANAT